MPGSALSSPPRKRAGERSAARMSPQVDDDQDGEGGLAGEDPAPGKEERPEARTARIGAPAARSRRAGAAQFGRTSRDI